MPPFNIQEKSFEYEIITNNKSEILIEGQELVYPTEVKEMFLPNNNGIVFKELLFVIFHKLSNYILE